MRYYNGLYRENALNVYIYISVKQDIYEFHGNTYNYAEKIVQIY